MNNGAARIAGHENDPKRGLSERCLFGEFTTIHARHDDIGEEQSDVLVFFDEPEGIGPVCGFQHLVAEVAEGFDDIARTAASSSTTRTPSPERLRLSTWVTFVVSAGVPTKRRK